MPWGVVAGAAIGAIGSMSAADTQASAQNRASDTQLHMFDTINSQEQPFIKAGYGATNSLSQMLGIGGDSKAANYGSLVKSFTPQDFLKNLDPGYQFQLQTGAQALRNADTPGVGALSGPALKDLMSFNQGMASTGYQNAFNRFTTQQNNIFSRLSAIAGLGQNAATQVGTAGTSLGTGAAQAQAAAGGSLAGGIVGASNALGQGATALGYLYGQNSTPSLDPGWGSGANGNAALADAGFGGGGS